MSIADTFDQTCEAHGAEILYMPDGADPLPFKAMFKDYGYGAEPPEVNKRFRQGASRWAKFTFSSNRLGKDVSPVHDEQVRVGESVFTVRQFQPTHVGGEVQIWRVFANTDQRG